ncbi:hypothetical protein V5N11_022607 [Cardamine amara subsp. amara]|uniref:Bromo domain-containing protein n=1 Tax=Cardamine amara subsp. amara TaxID=228776 RepID=A0ABD1AVP9_CARAN
MEGMSKEEEEAGSYNSMNVQETNNDYICSDDYHNREEDDDVDNCNKSQAWGTWEELLLACAVKRHGLADWDSVATEVRSRSSLSHLLASANNCRHKYRDLKLRFQKSAAGGENTDAADEEDRVGINNNIPWLEQLRSLRVAELRREVERYDVSILSLQLKVKKLEEEREGNVVIGELKPDLEDEREIDRSENDGCESEHREKAVSAAEESDRDNRSMNESNSTATAGEDERVGGDEPSQTRDDSGDNNPDLDPVNKDAAEEEEGSEASHSGESGTSERKCKRKRRKLSGSEDSHGGSGEIRSVADKSQPLIDILDLIRSHPRGSLFERRLRSQETKHYKSLVKQHLDIATIQRKLKQRSYDSSSLSFYRDLQLLFTNAIIFFPSSSSESMAAHELRTFVSQEMRKETGKSGPKLIKRQASAMNSIKTDAETSDSSLSRQKSSALVVCKKRSSVSAKASPSSSSFSQKEETKEETLSEEKENIVTGVRSSRRGNKVVAAVTTNNTKTGKGKNKQKQTESKTNLPNESSSKQETGKKEKVSSEKKKSVADFLKRLKKNSPQKEVKDQKKSGGSGKKDSKTKPRELRSTSVGKKKAEVENTPVKRAPGRPQKKTAEAGATATALGKRGRDTGSTGKDNKQPKKRVRR